MFAAWSEYLTDATQRAILALDTIRQVGNGAVEREQTEDEAHPVLLYDYTIILDGHTLPRPVNYLLVQALRRLHEYYGSELKVECPTRSGQFANLEETANEISRRIISIFRRDELGYRPVLGSNQYFQTHANWRDMLPFHEYFHGDSGRGVGASHQTGWTALVACLIFDLAESQRAKESMQVSAVEIEE